MFKCPYFMLVCPWLNTSYSYSRPVKWSVSYRIIVITCALNFIVYFVIVYLLLVFGYEVYVNCVNHIYFLFSNTKF